VNGFLPLAFGAPIALLALFALPAIWWLLRLTPPKPQTRDFPPTAMLRDLVPPDETPAHTPWWLLLLRFALATAVILAFAAPVWRPSVDDDGRSGPLWLIVDDGWPAAPGWEETRAAIAARIDRAARRDRPVVLAATADGADQSFDPTSPDEALRRLATLAPRPRAATRLDLVAGLTRSAAAHAPGSIVWFTDGIDLAAPADGRAFAEALAKIGRDALLTVAPPARLDIRTVDAVDNGLDALTVKLSRVTSDTPADGRLRALDPKGRVLAEVPFAFAADRTVTEARFDLPTAVRNDVARVEIADEPHAGAVALLDERWRRRVVGLVSGAGFDRAQPLLGPGHYLDKAIAPFADLRRPKATETGTAILEAIDANISVLLVADVGNIPGEAGARLEKWVENGGTLVRFAGPRLTGGHDDDPLLPVVLRGGERTLGGALTWGAPRGLGAYPATGPFAGMTVAPDIRISRQILAEPGPDLADRTWAVLDDGTPLVTAARRGAGRIVLFHVGAETSWSNLPLSGTFVEMLRRITALSAATRAKGDGAAAGTPATLPPWRLLDGFGRLGAPGPEARPISAATPPERPSRDHPPGLWGGDDAFLALQTRHTGDPLAAVDLARLDRATVAPRTPVERRDLRPLLLTLALILAAIDTAILLVPWLRRRRLAAASLLVALALAAVPLDRSSAAETGPTRSTADAFALAATHETHLAHVLTGDAALDDIAHRGLVGLSRVLSERTAVDLGDPIGVDPARDELAFFPLLYFPVAADVRISPTALARIDAFMKNGGTVIFDTRDAADTETRGGRPTPAGAALRRILAGLDLPDLEPVPGDHVLGRTFYLLRDFPGRFDGRLWVEATPPADPDRPAGRPARPGDGVSPLIVTGNDLAGAWAVDDAGDDILPMAASDPRSREMAYRVGVNIVMYTLTGNYKADQVHVPTLLQRLGR
jgi:hypothetical protein